MNRTICQKILALVVACASGLGLWSGKAPFIIQNHELSSKLLEIRDYVTSQGGSVVDVTPEKDLIVWLPDTFDPSQSSYTIVPYSVGLAPHYQSRGSSTRDDEPCPTLSPEAFAKLREKLEGNRSSETRSPSPAVEPNTLSQYRAMIRGEVNLPSAADNSLSKYFPPITYQIGSSCVPQTLVYYARTYFNAKVKDVSASNGEWDTIYNPYYEAIPRTEVRVPTDGFPGTPYSFYPHEFNYENLDIMTPSEYTRLIPTGQTTRRALDDIVLFLGCMDYTRDIITGQFLYTDNEMRKIKQRLANGEILPISVAIGEWQDEVDKGPVVYKLANHSGNGGHSMTLVGYDDNKSYTLANGSVKKGALLVANSWGNRWGHPNSLGIDKGYVWIAYDIFKTDIGQTSYYILKKDDEWKAKLTMRIVLDVSAQPYGPNLASTPKEPFVIKAFNESNNLVWEGKGTFRVAFLNAPPHTEYREYPGCIDISDSIKKLPLEKLNYSMQMLFPDKDWNNRPFVGSLTIKKIEMYKTNASNQDQCVFADHTVRTLLPGGSPVTIEIKPSSGNGVLVGISPDTATVAAMGTTSFTATVTGTTHQDVTWSCTPNGGTVSPTGLYTAPSKAGTYTVTATSKTDTSKSATATVIVSSGGGGDITFNEAEPNDGLATANAVPDAATTLVGFLGTSTDIDTYAVNVGAGEKMTIDMTGPANKDYDLYVFNSTGNLLTYSEGNTSSERVNVINTGTTTSTCMLLVKGYAGACTATTPYTLTLTRSGGGTPTVTVTLNPSTVTLQAGATQAFTATITGTTNTGVIWTCTNGTINQGLYTAPSTVGTTTVTATSKADTSKSASATVTVTSSGGGGGSSETTFNEAEANDDLSTANTLPDSTTKIVGFIGTPTDNDYYLVHAGPGASLTVNMTGPSNKDYDLFLYDRNGDLIKISQALHTSTERVTITNTGSTTTTTFIRVRGYLGDCTTTTPYTLTLSQ